MYVMYLFCQGILFLQGLTKPVIHTITNARMVNNENRKIYEAAGSGKAEKEWIIIILYTIFQSYINSGLA